MKTGSRRGAALAYVILISAAMLILAGGLFAAAKYNVDASTNSLESRQAYLDAKSAIEFGRAYLKNNPQTGTFSIMKTATALGFEAQPGQVNGAAAVYDSTQKTINATAKYRSSDRVRKLGYHFTATSTANSQSDLNIGFLISGSVYGSQYIFSYYNQDVSQNAVSVYPILSHNYRQIQGTITVQAPQIYILGKNWDSNSVIIYRSKQLTLKSDFIYLAGGIDAYPGDNNQGYQPLYLQSYSDTNGGILCVGKDVVNKNTNTTILQAGKYYRFKNNANLFHLLPGDLQEIAESQLPAYAGKNYTDFLLRNDGIIVSGDTWQDSVGVNWSKNGEISGQYYPLYIVYQKEIQQYSGISAGQIIQKNYQAGSGLSNYSNKIVFWYLNNVTQWGNVLWGNDDPGSNDYYFNVSNVYLSKKLNMKYVNPNRNSNFEVPENKTVVFKADEITLDTAYSGTDAGSGTNRPKITHAGSSARFILEAQAAGSSTQLYVPNDTTVQYQNNTKNYTMKAGYYNVISLNLFSDSAKTFFETTVPSGSPSGGSGGGSGGGATLSGGVYTDGQ